MIQAGAGRLAVPRLQGHPVTVHRELGGGVVTQQRPHRVDERGRHDDLRAGAIVPGGAGVRDGHPVPVGGHHPQHLTLDVEQDAAEHRQLRIGTRGEADRVQRGGQLRRGDGHPDGGGAGRGHGVLPVVE